MITLKKFEASDFEELRGEPSVASLCGHLTEQHLENLEKVPYAYTGLKNGRVIFIGGVSEYWLNRGEGWAILASSTGKDMLEITRIARKFLAACPVKRIEAAVDVNFEKGHKWVKLLGFKMEAPVLEAYLPEGKNCSLYARIRSA